MRTTELFSQSEETICETMIPGIVNDELGPATTIEEPTDGKPFIKLLFSILRDTNFSPKSLFDDGPKDSYTVLHGVKIARTVNANCFEARDFCRAKIGSCGADSD